MPASVIGKTHTYAEPCLSSVSRSRVALSPSDGLRRTARAYARFLWLALVGYAIFGKGFAYVRIGPLYVGELLIVAGVVVLLGTPGVRKRFLYAAQAERLFVLLALFCGWCAVRTVPYISRYGLDAVRDAAFWYYAFFAFMVYALLGTNRKLFMQAVQSYRWFAHVFGAATLILYIPVMLGMQYPTWPGTHVPVVLQKFGDIGVHIGGTTSFWATGLLGLGGSSVVVALNAAVFLLVACINRGGALACVTAIAIIGCTRRKAKVLRVLALGCVAIAALSYLPPVPLANGRKFAVQQVYVNTLSTIFASRAAESGLPSTVAGTEKWRLKWWSEIVQYTFAGKYFWTGKGFGINLADSDGYQVADDDSLRSPHNATMTVLARAGVPGLAFWLAFLVAFGAHVTAAYRRCMRSNQTAWANLLLFSFALWLAFLINSSFDVSLEGPMCGIWFWSVTGFGLAAARASKCATEPHAVSRSQVAGVNVAAVATT